jgi:hypothetical protein
MDVTIIDERQQSCQLLGSLLEVRIRLRKRIQHISLTEQIELRCQ